MEGIALHHQTYDRLGTERVEDLVPLCAACHQGVHQLHQSGRYSLSEVTDLVVSPFRNAEPSQAVPFRPFVPANQRGATRLPDGRLVSTLDWRDEARSIRGMTNSWAPHSDD
jgi:hypothetical protein